MVNIWLALSLRPWIPSPAEQKTKLKLLEGTDWALPSSQSPEEKKARVLGEPRALSFPCGSSPAHHPIPHVAWYYSVLHSSILRLYVWFAFLSYFGLIENTK